MTTAARSPTASPASNCALGGQPKFSLWEGGIRVPSCVRWKGHVPEGVTRDEPVISLDIFPTLLAAAGLWPAPPDKRFDGVNLLPLLLGRPTPDLAGRRLFWRSGRDWAIREGKWKLVQPESGEPTQLFDLSADIGETRDLSQEHPRVVRRLKEAWDAWDRTNLPTPMPSDE